MTQSPTSEKIRLPRLDDDTTGTVNRLLEQLRGRRQANLVAGQYNDGKRFLRRVQSGIIPAQYYNLGLVLGWSPKAVELLGRRTNLDGFQWAEGDLADLGLRELMDANQFLREIDSAQDLSLLHGPSFLINTVGDEGEGEHRSLIHAKDALNATGDWNARRRHLDNLLSITGRGEQAAVLSFAFYADGRTLVAQRDSVGSPWSWEWQEHDFGVPVELLAYKPTTTRPFGRSRITRPMMGLQDAATRGLIRLEGHMDIYGEPDYWLLGADETVFQNDDGSVKDAAQVRLGRIKGIPDDDDAPSDALARADVKQFAASDPTPHLSHINALAKMFARESQLPDTALAITDVSNPTSAESYDASQYELIAEAEGATRDWSLPTRRAIIRGLAIQNGERSIPEAWKSIDAKYRNPRYLARSAEADAGMKNIAAVPWLADTEVGLELLGLSEVQIRRALAERQRSSGRAVLEQFLGQPDGEPSSQEV